MADEIQGGSVQALSFNSKDFDNAKYATVAASAKLREVKLTRSNYYVKPDLYALPSGHSEGLRHSYFGKPQSPFFDPERGFLIGGYSWAVSVKKGRKQVLSFKAEYLIIYSGLVESDISYAELYFRKISRFTSYPYFRALFASNVMNSGLSLAPLPSLTDRVD